MTKVELIQKMFEGYKVSNTDWDESEYIYYDFEDEKFRDELGYPVDINSFLVSKSSGEYLPFKDSEL